VVAGIPGSPLQPILPFGAQPLLPFRAAARAVGLDTLQPVFQATVAIVAVLGSAIAFLYALRETWRGTIGLRAVLWLGIALVARADVATIVLVARLSGRLWPQRAAFATALVAWNPVVLFHSVGGGHNDLLVALSIAGALCLLAGRTGARRGDVSPVSPGHAR